MNTTLKAIGNTPKLEKKSILFILSNVIKSMCQHSTGKLF